MKYVMPIASLLTATAAITSRWLCARRFAWIQRAASRSTTIMRLTTNDFPANLKTFLIMYLVTYEYQSQILNTNVLYSTYRCIHFIAILYSSLIIFLVSMMYPICWKRFVNPVQHHQGVTSWTTRHFTKNVSLQPTTSTLGARM